MPADMIIKHYCRMKVIIQNDEDNNEIEKG